MSNHSYHLDTISYRNDGGYLYIRHTIYDSLNHVYSRPHFDVMTNSNTTVKTNIFGCSDGIYTSEVFGWRSDGNLTNKSTFQFINYTCGDLTNNDSVDISDLEYYTNFLFFGGPLTPHPGSMDFDCDGLKDIGDYQMLVDLLFFSGPPLQCCHSLN